MSELLRFLLARITEDEAAVHHRDVGAGRALDECKAKRRIIDEHGPRPFADTLCETCNAGDAWPCPTLRILAAIYADHPDYDEAWRA